VSRSIAFFDFDGTITRSDTFAAFIRYSKGAIAFYAGILYNFPYLIAWKLGFVSNQKAKERVLAFFFGGTAETEFAALCDRFMNRRLPELIRERALREISKLKDQGIPVIVVSASPENWICRWAEDNQLGLIASRLEIVNGIVTGKLSGRNCHGLEKARRIQELHDLTGYDVIYAYGDTKGDLPMLGLATKAFYRPFRNPACSG
jgi:phosphatidylglycerophosphatase C